MRRTENRVAIVNVLNGRVVPVFRKQPHDSFFFHNLIMPLVSGILQLVNFEPKIISFCPIIPMFYQLLLITRL